MTIFHGMLLFDIAETSINGWENQLGYRGYYEVWRNFLGEEMWMEVDEDTPIDEDGNVTWVLLYQQYDRHGDIVYWEALHYGTFREVDNYAKELMRKYDTMRLYYEGYRCIDSMMKGA